MHLCLIGLSHKTAPVEVREKLAVEPDQYPRVLAELSRRPELAECLVLSTCNRTEIYGVAEAYHAGRQALGEAMARLASRSGVRVEDHLYHRDGAVCVRHLFRVAASLDSMVVGEPQILGQLKDAFRAAADGGSTGLVLDRLLPHAFEVGKRVRHETAIGAYAVSVPSTAVALAKKIFGSFSGRHALVIGAGEMAETTLRNLRDAGVERITVMNRTLASAEGVARAFQAAAVGLDALPAVLASADIVIASAASPEPLVRESDVTAALHERRGRPVFLIDIGVPRNIDPRAGSVANAFLYDIDDLERVAGENRGRRAREAERAERMVEEEMERFLRWWEGLDAVPTIVALRSEVERLRAEESSRLLARLPHLSERDRELIEQFGATLVNKILHSPTTRIRNLGDAERSASLAASLRYLFQLDEKERARGESEEKSSDLPSEEGSRG